MVREIPAECRFCGQTAIVEVDEVEINLVRNREEFVGCNDIEIAQSLAGEKASKMCKCQGAQGYIKKEIRKNFESFVAGDVVNFMEQHKLEEIQVIDAYGNKAKLKKKESNSIEVTKTLKDIM